LASRALRWLLLVLACLAAIAVFLLATATANTELFAGNYNTLILVNGALVALLMLLVGWQLVQLWRKHRRGVFGSRLAIRLVLLFAMVAVLPGALVYAVSVQFLGRSIEGWFDVRVDRAMEGGLNLGRSSLDYLLKETTNRATSIAGTLADAPGRRRGQSLACCRAGGRVRGGVVRHGRQRPRGRRIGGSMRNADPLPGEALRRGRQQQTYAQVEQNPDRGLLLRVVVPVGDGNRLDPHDAAPGDRARAARPRAGPRKGAGGRARLPGDLAFARRAEARYALTLTLTLLLALTTALGLAVVLSERFAAPLGLLAEGTRAVAGGDFTRRQPSRRATSSACSRNRSTR
jgi:hypothetical protein